MIRIGAKPPDCRNGILYTVQRGDTMFKIARRFGISLAALSHANPQVTNPRRIFPGQELCVPLGGGSSGSGGGSGTGGGSTTPGGDRGDGFVEPTQPGVG